MVVKVAHVIPFKPACASSKVCTSSLLRMGGRSGTLLGEMGDWLPIPSMGLVYLPT